MLDNFPFENLDLDVDLFFDFSAMENTGATLERVVVVDPTEASRIFAEIYEDAAAFMVTVKTDDIHGARRLLDNLPRNRILDLSEFTIELPGYPKDTHYAFTSLVYLYMQSVSEFTATVQAWPTWSEKAQTFMSTLNRLSESYLYFQQCIFSPPVVNQSPPMDTALQQMFTNTAIALSDLHTAPAAEPSTSASDDSLAAITDNLLAEIAAPNSAEVFEMGAILSQPQFQPLPLHVATGNAHVVPAVGPNRRRTRAQSSLDGPNNTRQVRARHNVVGDDVAAIPNSPISPSSFYDLF